MALRATIPLLLLLTSCGASHEPQELRRQLGPDLFWFGSHLRLSEATPGSVFAAGEQVDLDARVAGDALVAGSQLELKGPFEADLYAAGGELNLDAEVDGSLRAAGGRVRLGPDSRVAGGVSIASGEADISGALDGYLQVAAGSTRLAARVAGDVDISGGSLEVAPSAVVLGTLIYRGSSPPLIAPGATLRGGLQHIAAAPEPAWYARGFNPLWTLGLAVLGALGLVFSPRLLGTWSEIARGNTTSALLVGAGLLIGTPVAALLSFLSVLGAPLGVISLALYALCLPLGYLISGLALSDWLWARWRPHAEPRLPRRLLALVLVLSLLSVLSGVPVLGWLLSVLLVSGGLGSMGIALARRFRRTHPGKPGSAAPPPRLEPGSLPQSG